MGPSKDIEPSELWRRLKERPRPSEVVEFPARVSETLGRVRIRVLTMEEQDDAKLAAHRLLKQRHQLTKDDLATELMAEYVGDTVAKELLARACVSEDAINADAVEQSGAAPIYARIFRDGADVNVLTAPQLSALFGCYLLVQERFGPTERTVGGPAELDAWIRRLVEGAAAYPLARLPLPALAELTMSLAARCYSLSCILEFLLGNSESTLDAARTSLDSGTCWSTELPSWCTRVGSSPSSDDRAPALVPVVEGVEGALITTAQAIEAARAMRGPR